MPEFNNWFTTNRLSAVDTEQRAVLCWSRIQDRPTTITLDRDGVNQSAQTVRIEYGERSNFNRNEVSGATYRDVWVIGVKDHPDATVVDTNIQSGDRFAIAYQTYQVMDVIEAPGEIQARCERIS